MYRSSYHRISDDSVSSYGGHPDLDSALAEANKNREDPDIDAVWVRDPDDQVVWTG